MAKKRRIDVDEVRRGQELLKTYRHGKAMLENRVVANEQWWRLRHWEALKEKKDLGEYESAWLFNMLLNKHADAMDNFPEPVILPREEGDKKDAEILSKVMPVVMEMTGMEDVYDKAWWAKLKHGTGVYGVFWNQAKENGLGDVEVAEIDILNIFWEPGVEDIQQSANVFVTEAWDRDRLLEKYPQMDEKSAAGSVLQVKDYIHEDAIDKSEKVVVVDWYYKKTDAKGRTRLHYIKFANDQLLFASENEKQYENGWYEHGEYPFVMDVLFPMQGSCAGFGFIDVAKKPQTLIDAMNRIIVTNAAMSGKKRWFIPDESGVNEEEYADFEKEFVHVKGRLDEAHIREITVSPVDGYVMNFMTMKIEELKETSGNRDVAQGGTTSGVTSASGIAAMQEASGKLSRDMIRKGYRAQVKVARLVLEVIRQFYTMPRHFRIVGERGQQQYLTYDARGIQTQRFDMGMGMGMGERRPVFDIQVKAQRANPYSTLAHDATIKELFGMGMFSPQMADQALIVLDALQIEGKEELIRKVQENGTMYQQIQMMQMQMQKMAQIIDAQNGTGISQGMAAEQQGAERGMVTPRVKEDQQGTEESSVTRNARARTAMTTRPT